MKKIIILITKNIDTKYIHEKLPILFNYKVNLINF